MSRNHILYPLSAALAATLALSACKKPEPAAPPPAPEATAPAPAPIAAPVAAASVVSVDLGNSLGADNRVAVAASTFAPADTIFAAVATRTADAAATVPGKLSAKWTYQDGQTVDSQDKDVASGPQVTDFSISKPDGWPAGKYKVEISLDGAVVQSRDFEVK